MKVKNSVIPVLHISPQWAAFFTSTAQPAMKAFKCIELKLAVQVLPIQNST